MSKKGNTRSRRRSLRIWGGYLLVLMAWVVAVMALAFLGSIICASITWQPSPLYDFLNWVRDYIVLVCIVTVLAGWVVISFYFISKPIKQLDVVANAAEQLSRPSEEPIQLPDSLEDISIQLNLAREQALRDARAAREAEQRKNDLIVYLAHDLKTPTTRSRITASHSTTAPAEGAGQPPAAHPWAARRPAASGRGAAFAAPGQLWKAGKSY